MRVQADFAMMAEPRGNSDMVTTSFKDDVPPPPVPPPPVPPPTVPNELLEPVVAYFRPRKVILFGSQARGDAGCDSDVDLFVIVDDDTPPERLSWQAKYEARKSWHRAVDIVTCRESVFERKRGMVGSLSHVADREGVVVYERH